MNYFVGHNQFLNREKRFVVPRGRQAPAQLLWKLISRQEVEQQMVTRREVVTAAAAVLALGVPSAERYSLCRGYLPSDALAEPFSTDTRPWPRHAGHPVVWDRLRNIDCVAQEGRVRIAVVE